MKQGATLLKIIFGMLLLAMLAYCAGAAFFASRKTYSTVAAISYEVGDGFQATGFVVRDEKVLSAPDGINVLLCAEGARVAKGEALAATFTDVDAQDAQDRMDEVTQQIAQLDGVLSSTTNLQNIDAPEEEIHTSLLRLAACVARENLQGAPDDTHAVKTAVLRRYLDDTNRSTLQQQAQTLKQELAGLRARLTGAMTQCTADVAGYFSGSTDGYESILNAQTIGAMTPSQFDALSSQGTDQSTGALGRLIISPEWYFVCTAPTEALAGLHAGDQLSAEFAFDPSASLPLRVVSISAAENGKQVLALSCNDRMEDVASLRLQAVDLVLHTYTGIRVPKSALRYENDAAGVYILEGAVAVWKPVKIIYEATDYFLVRQDKTSTGHLWPGDEIILTADTLTEGQVMDG